MFDVDIKILLILIPAMPLLATLVTAALGKPFLRGWSHLPTVVALAVSFVASLMLEFEDTINRHQNPRLHFLVSAPESLSPSGPGGA